ncbi:hypothetical protein HDU83_005825 [Entophlyctis luteolus]|nr:hypothetical protein HDU83_005825 [Entophlyctis luteolus]
MDADVESIHGHLLPVGASGNSQLTNSTIAATSQSDAPVAASSRSFSHTKLADDVHGLAANSTNFATVVASLPPLPPPPESSTNATAAKLPSVLKRAVSQKSSLHTPAAHDNRMERVRSVRNDQHLSGSDCRAPDSNRNSVRRTSLFAGMMGDSAWKKHSVVFNEEKQQEDEPFISNRRISYAENLVPSLPKADNHRHRKKDKHGGREDSDDTSSESDTYDDKSQNEAASLAGKSHGSHVGSNYGSVHSTNSEVGVVTKAMKWLDGKIDEFHDSTYYAKYRSVVNSVKYQILALAFLQLLLYASLFGVIHFVFGMELESISFYNLIHASMAIQGKCVIFVGFILSQAVAKGFAADDLVYVGIPLSELVVQTGKLNPPQGKQLRQLYQLSVLAIELSLWFTAYYMEWTTVDSDLGTYGCNVPTYNGNWTFTPDVVQFLQGDTEFSEIHSYGLPLVSGLVGGAPSFPNFAPSSSFSVEGDGLVFAINVDCAAPLPYNGAPTTNFTSYVDLNDEQNWVEYFNSAVILRLPAGSHVITQWADLDIVQKCNLQVVCGTGSLSWKFISDEWDSMFPYSINKITIGGHEMVAYMQPQLDFNTVVNLLGNSTADKARVTEWIQEAIERIFGHKAIQSSRRNFYADLLVWGTEVQTGKYNPAMTYRAVASAAAAAAHLVMNQIDANEFGQCRYVGAAGHGAISSPAWTQITVLALIGLSAFLEAFLVCSWLLLSGGGAGIDRAGEVMDNPLRLLYYMRSTAGKLVTKMRRADVGHVSLVKHFKNVIVKLGESKETRGTEIGTLKLDEPKLVVKIAKNRKYE